GRLAAEAGAVRTRPLPHRGGDRKRADTRSHGGRVPGRGGDGEPLLGDEGRCGRNLRLDYAAAGRRRMRITVVGSINLDFVAAAPSLPAPGETVTGASLSRHPGGKGANQALAARRLGAEVSL